MTGDEVNVLLYGLGAIGGFYTFILSRNSNVRLTVIARSNFEAVTKNGLKIESEIHGTHTVRPNRVLKSPSEANGTFDYIVCAHKAVDSQGVPERFRNVTGKETTFVIIQNGVGIEEPFRETFPGCTIISCVTWTGAVQIQPGVIKHLPTEAIEMGLFQNPDNEASVEQKRLETFASLLKNGGTKVTTESNIQINRWQKVVWNAAWNPLTTLTMVDTQTWLHCCDQSLIVTKRLMREITDIANRCGVPVEYSLIDKLIGRILTMPGIGSSMQTDAKEGRPLEVDVILGVPIRKARESGMEIPTLETVYALTMAVDVRLRQKTA